MPIGLIYSIVIFFACVVGAIAGLGGGVFIRPVFDAIGHHDVLNIGFFASLAIFTMAIVSTAKKIQGGAVIHAKTALVISLGAIIGGILGNLLLEHLLTLLQAAAVQRIQTAATLLVLILALFLSTKTGLHFPIKIKAAIPVLGVLLGITAAFLGIGGGPIGVPFFMIFFGLSIKDATTYSIIVIFFSHLARLLTLGVTVGYQHFDLALLPYVIIAAALGGLMGAKLSTAFSEKTVKRLFQGSLATVVVLNITNALFLLN